MIHIDDKNFDKEVIKSKVPVLIDFYADWCGPCRMLGPILEEFSNDKSFDSKLRFVKLNTEEYPEIAQDFNVQGIPCMIIIKDGKEANRIVGYSPKPVLKSNIEGILKKL